MRKTRSNQTTVREALMRVQIWSYVSVLLQINKPYLPLVTGELSVQGATNIIIGCALAALAIGVASSSPPLLATLVVSLILGEKGRNEMAQVRALACEGKARSREGNPGVRISACTQTRPFSTLQGYQHDVCARLDTRTDVCMIALTHNLPHTQPAAPVACNTQSEVHALRQLSLVQHPANFTSHGLNRNVDVACPKHVWLLLQTRP